MLAIMLMKLKGLQTYGWNEEGRRGPWERGFERPERGAGVLSKRRQK
jgi:hypothetical protein